MIYTDAPNSRALSHIKEYAKINTKQNFYYERVIFFNGTNLLEAETCYLVHIEFGHSRSKSF